MSFISKVRRKLATSPGASIVVMQGTAGKRMRFDLAVQHLEKRAAEIRRDMAKLRESSGLRDKQDEEAEAIMRAWSADRLEEHNAAMSQLVSSFDLEYSLPRLAILIEHAVVKVEGLEVDGVELGPGDLMESAPPDVIREVATHCELFTGLTWEQQKNSESPTISPAVVAPSETPSTAGTAA